MKTHAPIILDFDVECRPIAWYGGDFVTKQPTAVGWKIVGSKGEPEVRAIGESGLTHYVLDEEEAMLLDFCEVYDNADIVTGHFIRSFDLPVINGALVRLGLTPLEQKLAQDTKLDFYQASGISKSMENLSAMFEAKHQKFPMNTALWGKSNMLLPEGIELAKKRVSFDVVEHIELRQTMLDLGVLGPAKMWTPTSKGKGGYIA
jgi:hypothetical protein